MIRFIRDPQPPNTQYKQGMVRDLGAALNASFKASGDAVDAAEPGRAFPPAQRLLPAGVAQESPAAALTGSQVAAAEGLLSEAGNITAAELLTTIGITGQTVRLSDGENRGAILMWSTPEGASAETWCWWLWPQSRYEA